MKNIVITGSTRGIGLALAKAFLERGCRVIISGRRQESVVSRSVFTHAVRAGILNHGT